MQWRLTLSGERKRMAILVSKHDHALLEVLWAWKRGELRADITAVVSNHPDLGESVGTFGVPFVHVPNSAATRPQAEARMAEVIGKPDFLVLARYMQIVSPPSRADFRKGSSTFTTPSCPPSWAPTRTARPTSEA